MKAVYRGELIGIAARPLEDLADFCVGGAWLYRFLDLPPEPGSVPSRPWW